MNRTFASVSYEQDRLTYSIDWATKCRYSMFRFDKYKTMLETILVDICSRHSIKILELTVMPEHVHMVIGIPAVMSVSDASRYIRGGSAYALFRAEPLFRRRYPRGSFWSGNKFVRTVGADIEASRQYVRNQEQHHSHKYSQL